MTKITEAFKLKYDNIFAKLLNITVDELHFDKLKLNKSICVNENAWQTHLTPDSICKQMLDLYFFKDNDKILVLFNLEIVKNLVCRKVKKENIYFISDYSSKSEFLFKYFKEINYINLNEYSVIDLEEKIKSFNVKKFDIVFSNPPYEKNLHLKICDIVFKYSEDVIFIEPIRWLESPTSYISTNNKGDFKKFSIIRNAIKDLKVIAMDKAEKLFNIPFNFDLGICYYSHKNSNYDLNPFYLQGYNDYDKIYELFKKVLSNLKNSFKDNLKYSEPKNISVIISLICGGNNGRTKFVNKFFYKSFNEVTYDNNKRLDNGKSFYENRLETCWGNVKPRNEQWHIEFNSINEANNFYKSCQTEFWRFFNMLTIADVHVHPEYLIFMNNYLNIWTNDDYCKFFNLSDNDKKFIIETINYYDNMKKEI